MSDKTTTTTTNQYNQAANGNYNMFQGTLGTMLTDYAKNPLASSFFNQQYQQNLNNANQIGARNMFNVTNNLRTGGGLLGNSGAFLQSQINRTARSNTGLQAGAFNSSLASALQNRQWALGSMEAYQPLQTGQTSVQQTQQGLGSILGQVAGMGLSMAMPGIGSMLGGGSFSGGYKPSGGGGGSLYQVPGVSTARPTFPSLYNK